MSTHVIKTFYKHLNIALFLSYHDIQKKLKSILTKQVQFFTQIRQCALIRNTSKVKKHTYLNKLRSLEVCETSARAHVCPSTGTTVCVSIRIPSINNNVTKRHHNKLKKKIIFVEINILLQIFLQKQIMMSKKT